MQDKKELNWQMRGSKLCYLKLRPLEKTVCFLHHGKMQPLGLLKFSE